MDHIKVTGTLFVRHAQVAAILAPTKLTSCQFWVGLNQITDIGLTTFAGLLAGGFGTPTIGSHGYGVSTIVRPDTVPATGAYVYEMRVGNHANPTPPVPTDLVMTGGYVWSGKMSVVAPTMTCSYPFAGAVDFTTLIPNALIDSGVTSYTEEALFNIDGAMLARIVLDPAWAKPATGFTQFTHRISFARAT